MGNNNIPLTDLNDVIDAKDISKVLGIGYAKALWFIRFSGIPFLKIGRTYLIAKVNFIQWVNSTETQIIEPNSKYK
jgi:hypothetical protein